MSSGGRISDVIDLEEIGESDHVIAIALPGGARHCRCLCGDCRWILVACTGTWEGEGDAAAAAVMVVRCEHD